MVEDDQDKIVIDFIDPLFAIVLHISFVEIMTKTWFADFRLALHAPYNFDVTTLALAYVTIILSWIGYHRSIKKNPIRLEHVSGQCRFFLDISLLIAYFVLVVSFENFRRVLWLFVVIYCLFFLWDQFKRAERPESNQEASARRGVTVFWLITSLAVALFYHFDPPTVSHECEDWIILLALILSTWLYRWHKEHLDWLGMKRLLLVLGFPRANG